MLEQPTVAGHCLYFYGENTDINKKSPIVDLYPTT